MLVSKKNFAISQCWFQKTNCRFSQFRNVDLKNCIFASLPFLITLSLFILKIAFFLFSGLDRFKIQKKIAENGFSVISQSWFQKKIRNFAKLILKQKLLVAISHFRNFAILVSKKISQFRNVGFRKKLQIFAISQS